MEANQTLERGAENLLGKGDMYFKSPEFSELKRIQGTYITSSELNRVIQSIKASSFRLSIGKYRINLSDNSSRDMGHCWILGGKYHMHLGMPSPL